MVEKYWEIIKDWSDFLALVIFYALGVLYSVFNKSSIERFKNFFQFKKNVFIKRYQKNSQLIRIRLNEMRIRFEADRIMVYKIYKNEIYLVDEILSSGILSIENMDNFSEAYFPDLSEEAIFIKNTQSDTKYKLWYFNYAIESALIGLLKEGDRAQGIIIFTWGRSKNLSKFQLDEFKSLIEALKK